MPMRFVRYCAMIGTQILVGVVAGLCMLWAIDAMGQPIHLDAICQASDSKIAKPCRSITQSTQSHQTSKNKQSVPTIIMIIIGLSIDEQQKQRQNPLGFDSPSLDISISENRIMGSFSWDW